MELSGQFGIMMTTQQIVTANDWFFISPMPAKLRLIQYEDSETAAMTDEEIKAEVLAMAGSWADRDDIDDNWLDDLRASWDDRLEELYGDEPQNSI